MKAYAKPIVWSIAASDSGGGAGIQADLHTFATFNCHGCTVITAITAQNSLTVSRCEAVNSQLFLAQLDTLAADMPPTAIKIGLLPDSELILLLADWLKIYRQLHQVTIIADPVFSSSSGYQFSAACQITAWQKLLPQLDLLTPNLPELALLVPDHHSPQAQAEVLLQQGVAAVLVKGGHSLQLQQVSDHFISHNLRFQLVNERYNTPHQHGTGCVLSAAIAAATAQQYAIPDAVILARAYLQQALKQSYATGAGSGSLMHIPLPVPAEYFPQLQPTKQFAPLEHPPGLYPLASSLSQLQELLQQGANMIQLRIKNCPSAKLEPLIAEAVACARRYQAKLFINDYWQLAIQYQAYGVHLGQEDLQQADLAMIADAGLRLGISTHGYYELAVALAIRPSYIALGHIFATTTKQMPSKPQGLRRLQQYAQLCRYSAIPAVAIGGISAEHFSHVAATGVSGIAVVSAIWAQPSPAVAFHQLQQLWQETTYAH